jgi:hypothetical protein
MFHFHGEVERQLEFVRWAYQAWMSKVWKNKTGVSKPPAAMMELTCSNGSTATSRP